VTRESSGYELAHEFPGRIERFARTLALWGARHNLTAQPEDPNEIAFHVLDSIGPLIAYTPQNSLGALRLAGRRVLDFGSGAGFPGLVLAAASEAQFVLTESRRKRASFLSAAVADMGLDNVAVESTRASLAIGDHDFDFVTSRATGDIAEVLQIAHHSLRTGGVAIIYMSEAQKIDPASSTALRLGFAQVGGCEYQVARKQSRVRRTLLLLHR